MGQLNNKHKRNITEAQTALSNLLRKQAIKSMSEATKSLTRAFSKFGKVAESESFLINFTGDSELQSLKNLNNIPDQLED